MRRDLEEVLFLFPSYYADDHSVHEPFCPAEEAGRTERRNENSGGSLPESEGRKR